MSCRQLDVYLGKGTETMRWAVKRPAAFEEDEGRGGGSCCLLCIWNNATNESHFQMLQYDDDRVQVCLVVYLGSFAVVRGQLDLLVQVDI